MSETNASFTMDKPFEHSLLDETVQGVIGTPAPRIDGPLKVAGQATYTAEYDIADVAYGYLVSARVGSGHVTGIDGTAAKAMPGVIEVFSNFKTFLRNAQQGGEEKAPTQGVQDIAYMGEPVAIVVAESYEQARDAAEMVEIKIEAGEPGRYDFDALINETEKPADDQIPAHYQQGDVDQAMADAPVTLDVTYVTPSQTSAAMEMHASTAVWDGDRLTLYGSYQMLASCRKQLADALSMAESDVRILSPYVGGGFGSKLGISPESVAAALAAKAIGRPVKTVMTRQQVFEATVRRSNTRQRVRLAANADGTLTAIGHEMIGSNLPGEDYFEPAGMSTHFLYGGENRLITHDLVRLDWLVSGSMRAPGEAVGMLALETAMDELAETLKMDPIALRRLNDPVRHPEKDLPYSARSLTRCMDEGAEAFGWTARNPVPGTRLEGEWLVGIGMAAAARSNQLQKSAARVTITPNGRALVETDMTDIGTGTYTILAQIAGEMLGLPLDRVDVRLGDTDLPPAAGSGGSWGAGSSGSSVYVACDSLRQQLAKAMDCDPAELTLKDGKAIAGNHAVEIGSLVGDGLAVVGTIQPGGTDKTHTQASYGAHFAEVAVNAITGEVRVRRMLGVFAAGRILNEKTARSQCIGGMVFGIGAALTEELVHDPRNGKLVNRDLAEYHVPVNADVPQIEVMFLPERDTIANPMHAKGLGELGISGAGAAIANAVYNACGVRVREYPLTLDKILAGLPSI